MLQGKGFHEVIKDWAMSKIPTLTDTPDSIILEIMKKKLSSSPGLSCSQIAHEAHKRYKTFQHEAFINNDEPCCQGTDATCAEASGVRTQIFITGKLFK